MCDHCRDSLKFYSNVVEFCIQFDRNNRYLDELSRHINSRAHITPRQVRDLFRIRSCILSRIVNGATGERVYIRDGDHMEESPLSLRGILRAAEYELRKIYDVIDESDLLQMEGVHLAWGRYDRRPRYQLEYEGQFIGLRPNLFGIHQLRAFHTYAKLSPYIGRMKILLWDAYPEKRRVTTTIFPRRHLAGARWT